MKTKLTTSKLIALLTIAALILSMCAMIAGCGDDKDKKDATSASSKPAETAAVQATEKSADVNQGSQDSGNQDSDTQDSGNQDAGSGSEEKYAGLSMGEACNIALQNTADHGGQVVTIADPGEYNGEACWKVVVQTTTTTYLVCYVTPVRCDIEEYIPEDSIFNDSFAGTSPQDAANLALDATGTGATVISTIQSEYAGADAWEVMTVDTEGNYHLFYIQDGICYPT